MPIDDCQYPEIKLLLIVNIKKLKWMPINDVIRVKKLCMMFKIVNGESPHYLTSYRTYVKNTYSYNTRASFHDHLVVPK